MKSENLYARTSVSFTNNSDQFLLRQKSYNRQYAHIYSSRLWSFRHKLEKAATIKWGTKLYIL